MSERAPLTADEQFAARRYSRLLIGLGRDLDIMHVELAVASGLHRATVDRHFDGETRPTAASIRAFADAFALLAGRPEVYADSVADRLTAAAGVLVADRPVSAERAASWVRRALPLEARLLRAVRCHWWAEVDAVTARLRDDRQVGVESGG